MKPSISSNPHSIHHPDRVGRRFATVRLPICFPLALVTGLLLGCGGGGEMPTAPVHGKVTHNGEAVTGGSLSFLPIAAPDEEVSGKPASAEVQSDGTYVLGTYGTGDGAVLGKHEVTYTPPSNTPEDSPEGEEGEEAPTPHEQAEPPKYAGLVPKEQQVEVTDGDNEINIELVPGSRPEEEL